MSDNRLWISMKLEGRRVDVIFAPIWQVVLLTVVRWMEKISVATAPWLSHTDKTSHNMCCGSRTSKMAVIIYVDEFVANNAREIIIKP